MDTIHAHHMTDPTGIAGGITKPVAPTEFGGGGINLKATVVVEIIKLSHDHN